VGLLHGFGRSVGVAAIEKIIATTRGITPLKMLEWLAAAEEQRSGLALAVAERWQLPHGIIAALKPEAASTPMGELVAEGERIAGVLENSWRPEPAVPSEARALDELILGLPAALDALAAVPPPTPGRPASAVASVSHALDGALHACHLEVTDCKKQGRATLTTTSIAATGLELRGSQALQESSMVRLAIGSGDERFETWFNVVLCAPEASGCRVEVELFSPTRELKERWLKMYEQSR